MAVVQFSSWVFLFMTLWTVAHQASLSSTTSQSLLKFMSTETVMLFNHLILCSSFLLLMLSNYLILCRRLLLLPSVFSSIRIFTNELALCIRWPKYWSLSFSISPSNEYTGVISFGWAGLIMHHNLKTWVLWFSAFFTVQFSHPYMTTGKTVALAIQIFVGKLMSLLFNTLFMFVIASFQGANVF